MLSTSVNMFSANWGRLPHFDKNGIYWGELQLYYSYKPLIYDVDISTNEKQTAFPIKTFHDRIELRPKTTNNKRMQTVLKEVVEVGIKPLGDSKVNSTFHSSF